MDIIYCLVGPSGSGKTTIAKILHEEKYNVILSYTTRAPREPGEWGHTFQTAPYVQPKDVIAYNEFNGHHYWAVRNQFEGKGISIYIIDPPGDSQLRKAVDCPVVTIFLRIGRETALHRMDIERGREKALERVEHDRGVFASVKADWVVDADRPIPEVLDDILGIIGGNYATSKIVGADSGGQ